jgi:hypothetical protein
MNSRFDLTPQEVSILMASMQCMTKSEEAHAGPPLVVSRLYNKLYTRHEYLLRLQQDYEPDI